MPAPEYPDTVFGRTPRAYGTGRAGYGVRLSVVHYTAGAESRSSAENGNAYDAVRTDGTSCHVFHDPDSSVQEVLRKDRANSALHRGNRLGIQHELCGTAQTRAQWLDANSDAILWRAARAVAKDCVDYGLEPRRLSVSEVRRSWTEYPNGPRGICGHVDITHAFPEDGGDHTDPGAGFPWDIFLTRVRQYINNPTGDDMPDFTPEDPNAWAQALRVDALRTGIPDLDSAAGGGKMWLVEQINKLLAGQAALADALATGGGSAEVAAVIARIDALEAAQKERVRKAAQAEAIINDADPTNDPAV